MGENAVTKAAEKLGVNRVDLRAFLGSYGAQTHGFVFLGETFDKKSEFLREDPHAKTTFVGAFVRRKT